jgi:hypothetical protein
MLVYLLPKQQGKNEPWKTYALLSVWFAPTEALHNPQPALAQTADADCEVDVSAVLDEDATLHEIYKLDQFLTLMRNGKLEIHHHHHHHTFVHGSGPSSTVLRQLSSLSRSMVLTTGGFLIPEKRSQRKQVCSSENGYLLHGA